MPSAAPPSHDAGKPEWGARLEKSIGHLEAKLTKTEEENKWLREEVERLKKSLEEEVAARGQLEEKLRVVVEVDEEERTKIKTELEKEKEGRKRWEEEKIKEVKEDLKKVVGLEKEIKEVVERLSTRSSEEKEEKTAGAGDVVDEDPIYKCIVLTDSNGQRATEESIRTHMPADKRSKYEIQVVVAYRLEDAYERIEKKDHKFHVNVENSYVIIDNITNNIRGGKNNEAEPPDLVADRVAALRELILSNSAKAVVVCEPKPMKWVDVRYSSVRIHKHLVSVGKGGYGCRTQIRMRYLRDDGFHVQPKYDSIVDKTYACALLGVPVPDPTPFGDLEPEYSRRRWDNQFPKVGGRGKPKS